jgi:cytoskeletal protein CcmA (bactofilin family)
MRMGKEKTGKIGTIVGPNASFEGVLSSKEGIRIEGRVRGKIDCDGSLVIGNTGKVEAEIVADTVFIAGEVTGNITATNYSEITEEGKVCGDISTANLAIGQGGVFEGRCQMISQDGISGSSDSLSLPAPLAPSNAHATV